jgi:propanediol dehydratase small subunit
VTGVGERRPSAGQPASADQPVSGGQPASAGQDGGGGEQPGVRALSGRPVSELTLEAVRRSEISLPDLRIHPGSLEHQAAVAEAHGNPQLAENLRRAAELTTLGDDEVLAIYEALRPGRSTATQLTAPPRSTPAAASPHDPPAPPTCPPAPARAAPAARPAPP